MNLAVVLVPSSTWLPRILIGLMGRMAVSVSDLEAIQARRSPI